MGVGGVACPKCMGAGGQLVDWVIVGGESGHGARPMRPDWLRALRDQCAGAGVPMLFKQWGEWVDEFNPAWSAGQQQSDVFVDMIEGGRDYRGMYMGRAGKKNAGRLLDGVEHNGYPR
jgi:protein gp37